MSMHPRQQEVCQVEPTSAPADLSDPLNRRLHQLICTAAERRQELIDWLARLVARSIFDEAEQLRKGHEDAEE